MNNTDTYEMTCPICNKVRPIGYVGWKNSKYGHIQSRCPSCRARRLETELAYSLRGSPIYESWVHMRQRCTNPRCKDWKNYGGRGIKVCERWQSFDNFVEDMYPSYEEGLTIDRIDNDKDYEPDNVRWATKSEQGKHTGRIKYITYQGRTQNVSAWLAELNIAKSAVYAHISNGLTFPEAFDKILSSKEHTGGKRLFYEGQSLTVVEWAEKRNIPVMTIHCRIAKGWPIEKVLSIEKFRRTKMVK